MLNATIKDVAKYAGVSVATVSRVLNKSANVSSEATESVTNAIKELGYSPNSLGRNLRKCETNIILAVIPSTEHSFYSEVLRGMQSCAYDLGYDILMSTNFSNVEIEKRLLEMVFNRTVDAVVLLGTKLDADYLNSLNERYNIALCCERIEGANALTVTVDDTYGAYQAVSALINKGHKKIAMISTNVGALSSMDREQGYLKALSDNGITPKPEYIQRSSYDPKDGGYAFEKFMSMKEPPTAIFAVSDLLAMGAIRKALKKGYKVGDEISIIGFDDIQFSNLYVPSISTVRQPCFEIGQKVIACLINNITSSNKNHSRFKVKPELVLRNSTGD